MSTDDVTERTRSDAGEDRTARPDWRFSGRRGTPVDLTASQPEHLPDDVQRSVADIARERTQTQEVSAPPQAPLRDPMVPSETHVFESRIVVLETPSKPNPSAPGASMNTESDPSTPVESETPKVTSSHPSRPPLTDAERKKRMKARAKRRKELEKQRAKDEKAARKLDRASEGSGSGLFSGIFAKKPSSVSTEMPLDVPTAQELEVPLVAETPLPDVHDAIPVELPELPEDLIAQLEPPAEQRGADVAAPPALEDSSSEDLDSSEPPSTEEFTPVADLPSPAEDVVPTPEAVELPAFIGDHHPTPTTVAATASLQVLDAAHAAEDLPVEPADDAATLPALSVPAVETDIVDWEPEPLADTPPPTPRDRMRPKPRTRPAIPGHVSEIREREREIRERIEVKRRELDSLFSNLNS